jgi:hypothetical protein
VSIPPPRFVTTDNGCVGYAVPMADPIPAEARERAEATLANLNAALAPVLEHMPEDSNTAIVFRMPEEA